MKWVCHCTVHAYDGVSTLTSRPTEIVDATSEQEACVKVRQLITERYERLGCNVNSIAIPLVRKSTPRNAEVPLQTWTERMLDDFRTRTVKV